MASRWESRARKWTWRKVAWQSQCPTERAMKSNIPSGYMHVQPVPEGRSLRDALDHRHFCVCCCSKVCAGNYLPWCDCAVRGFWIDVLGSSTSSATQHIHCTRANLGSLSVLLASLLYPCFKTALRCDVVSGCFVRGASPSPRFRPELAPERGLGGPGLAFRTPESARKVHAKSFRLLCGTGRVVVLKLEVRLGLKWRLWPSYSTFGEMFRPKCSMNAMSRKGLMTTRHSGRGTLA